APRRFVPTARPDGACPRRRRSLAAQRRGVRRLPQHLVGRASGPVGRELPAPWHLRSGDAVSGRDGVPEAEERLMAAIFKAQLINLIRNPWGVLIMTLLTVVMSFIFGFQATSSINVAVVSSSELDQAQTAVWLARLNESDTFTFVLKNEAELRASLAS